MSRSAVLCYIAVLLLLLHGLPTPSNADEFTDQRVTIQIKTDSRGRHCKQHFNKPCTGVFNLRLPRFLPTNETRGNVFRRTWEDTVSTSLQQNQPSASAAPVADTCFPSLLLLCPDVCAIHVLL
jgi:hypothetical protein